MASSAALRHVSIGQYIPGDALPYQLDPRIKLIIWGLLLVAVIVATRYVSNLVLLGVILAITLSARLPIGYILASIRPALPIIVVLAIFQLLFYQGGAQARTLLTLGPVEITDAAVRVVIVSLMRFVDLLFLTSLLTNTTTTSALTHGIESLLRPLSAIGLPGHELAMVGSIALRFVPILGEELESITQAQASRGVRPAKASRLRFIDTARHTATLIIPLFVDVFRRAEEMTLAMQARCYRGGKGRTQLVQYRLTGIDYGACGAVLAILIVIMVLQILPLP